MRGDDVAEPRRSSESETLRGRRFAAAPQGGEAGVHRLVRISPYDSAARRHTSYSSAWIYPVVGDTISIENNESDLKVDTPVRRSLTI